MKLNLGTTELSFEWNGKFRNEDGIPTCWVDIFDRTTGKPIWNLGLCRHECKDGKFRWFPYFQMDARNSYPIRSCGAQLLGVSIPPVVSELGDWLNEQFEKAPSKRVEREHAQPSLFA